MIEKIKNMFNNKEKRVENLVSFLIILVITLIVINKILKGDESPNEDYKNEVGVELASTSGNINMQENNLSNELEQRLENILTKIDGVGKVSVLLTYKESSSFVPIYNISTSTSTVQETDTSGGTRTTETENNQKDVIKDANSNVVKEKIVMPSIEGAIITAEGARDATIKSNIIAAVEAVTGVANHKIQVFEMGDE